jgi:hypothetical protein
MSYTGKQITLGDFLYSDQIKKVFELKDAKRICDEVIAPNIEEINVKLGQECDPMYLAYACEFVVNMVEQRGGAFYVH